MKYYDGYDIKNGQVHIHQDQSSVNGPSGVTIHKQQNQLLTKQLVNLFINQSIKTQSSKQLSGQSEMTSEPSDQATTQKKQFDYFKKNWHAFWAEIMKEMMTEFNIPYQKFKNQGPLLKHLYQLFRKMVNIRFKNPIWPQFKEKAQQRLREKIQEYDNVENWPKQVLNKKNQQFLRQKCKQLMQSIQLLDKKDIVASIQSLFDKKVHSKTKKRFHNEIKRQKRKEQSLKDSQAY